LRLADRPEKVVARLLAAATDFGAESAVFVMGGVEVALACTDDAGRRTGFDHCPHEAKIRRGLPGDDAAGGVASVGAVEAQSNDAYHLLNIGLAQAGVGTGRATGGTVETLLYTTDESVPIDPGRLWMQLDDLLKGHVLPSLISFRLIDRSGTLQVRRPALLDPAKPPDHERDQPRRDKDGDDDEAEDVDVDVRSPVRKEPGQVEL
jgi:hypothetical protein